MGRSKLTKLKQKRDATEVALEGVLELQRQFGELAVGTCEALESEVAGTADVSAGDEGLNRPGLRDWMCRGITAASRKWCPRVIGTAGSGPWNIDDFDLLLESMGFQLAHLPNPDLKCIVLGANDCDEDDLSAQIYDRDGDDLLVLTQGMFIAGVIKSADPLEDLSLEELLAIAEGHAALAYLVDRGFDWGFETVGDSVAEWEPNQELAEKSPLRMAGYSVATSGPGEAARREVLEEFFFKSSPKGVDTGAERHRWGAARSAQRLYSMATFIAWLCRFQGPHAPRAVVRWNDDLAWLRKKFYKPTMRFEWPSVPTIGSKAGAPAKTRLNPAAAWPFPTGSAP